MYLISGQGSNALGSSEGEISACVIMLKAIGALGMQNWNAGSIPAEDQHFFPLYVKAP